MAISIAPDIAEADYPAFRAILDAEIPATYQEWLSLKAAHDDEKLKASFEVKSVRVGPEEFKAYCDDIMRHPDRRALWDFAEMKR